MDEFFDCDAENHDNENDNRHDRDDVINMVKKETNIEVFATFIDTDP